MDITYSLNVEIDRSTDTFNVLIGYYFDRQEAANASRKAFITNRIGDFGFALAIFGIIATLCKKSARN